MKKHNRLAALLMAVLMLCLPVMASAETLSLYDPTVTYNDQVMTFEGLSLDTTVEDTMVNMALTCGDETLASIYTQVTEDGSIFYIDGMTDIFGVSTESIMAYANAILAQYNTSIEDIMAQLSLNLEDLEGSIEALIEERLAASAGAIQFSDETLAAFMAAYNAIDLSGEMVEADYNGQTVPAMTAAITGEQISNLLTSLIDMLYSNEQVASMLDSYYDADSMGGMTLSQLVYAYCSMLEPTVVLTNYYVSETEMVFTVDLLMNTQDAEGNMVQISIFNITAGISMGEELYVSVAASSAMAPYALYVTYNAADEVVSASFSVVSADETLVSLACTFGSTADETSQTKFASVEAAAGENSLDCYASLTVSAESLDLSVTATTIENNEATTVFLDCTAAPSEDGIDGTVRLGTAQSGDVATATVQYSYSPDGEWNAPTGYTGDTENLHIVDVLGVMLGIASEEDAAAVENGNAEIQAIIEHAAEVLYAAYGAALAE